MRLPHCTVPVFVLLLAALSPTSGQTGDFTFIRGDSNEDSEVNLSDAIHLLGHLFLGNPRTLACRDSADANDDGSLNISDAIFMLGFLFLGDPAVVPEPFIECGVDRTLDTLACVSYRGDCGPVGVQWEARYDGATMSTEFAAALAVDSSGNVVVTGRSDDSGGDRDYVTVKYGQDGSQLWAARYDGPVSGWDLPRSVGSDGEGNTYVTGHSIGAGSGSDFATVKYDSSGRELWVARYDGPVSGSDLAEALAVDPSGNVLVIGRSDGSGSESDYVTVKYDLDGKELWTARYDGTASGEDAPRDVASDTAGNVYVTGYSERSGVTGPGPRSARDFVTVKYDPSGQELWVARYDGPCGKGDEPTSIVVDLNGFVYVGGVTSMGTPRGWDMATVKYDPQGNLLWADSYDGSLSSNIQFTGVSDIIADVAVDSAGNLYVTGVSEGEIEGSVHLGANSGFLTLKYDAAGNVLWENRFDAVGYSHEEAYSLALDGGGNVYVAGRSVVDATGADIVVVKYDSGGSLLWAVRHGGAGSVFDSPAALVLGSAGDVFVLGTSSSSLGDLDLLTLKLHQSR